MIRWQHHFRSSLVQAPLNYHQTYLKKTLREEYHFSIDVLQYLTAFQTSGEQTLKKVDYVDAFAVDKWKSMALAKLNIHCLTAWNATPCLVIIR